MGFIALPTSRNTRGYDILILDPTTNVGKGIQVKCTDRRDFPICSTYVDGFEEKLKETIVCDFVLVDISNTDLPVFYVMPKGDMLKLMENLIKGYIAKSRRELSKEKQQLWTIKLSRFEKELESYKNNWNGL